MRFPCFSASAPSYPKKSSAPPPMTNPLTITRKLVPTCPGKRVSRLGSGRASRHSTSAPFSPAHKKISPSVTMSLTSTPMKASPLLRECLPLVHHSLPILSNRPGLNTTKLTKEAEKHNRGDQGKEEKIQTSLQLRKRCLLCVALFQMERAKQYSNRMETLKYLLSIQKFRAEEVDNPRTFFGCQSDPYRRQDWFGYSADLEDDGWGQQELQHDTPVGNR